MKTCACVVSYQRLQSLACPWRYADRAGVSETLAWIPGSSPISLAAVGPADHGASGTLWVPRPAATQDAEMCCSLGETCRCIIAQKHANGNPAYRRLSIPPTTLVVGGIERMIVKESRSCKSWSS